jgi:hypothetical protein
MVGTEGANQSIDIEFYGVGARIAFGQEAIAGLDVGERGGHGVVPSVGFRSQFGHERNATQPDEPDS